MTAYQLTADAAFLASLRQLNHFREWDARRTKRLLALEASEVSGWSKRDRLKVLEVLGWDLGMALDRPAVTNRDLADFFGRLPSLLEALTLDSPRSPFAVYMFWDLTLFGVGPVFALGGPRAAISADVTRALLALRFSPRANLRRSAEHGLYHLAQALGTDLGDAAHP